MSERRERFRIAGCCGDARERVGAGARTARFVFSAEEGRGPAQRGDGAISVLGARPGLEDEPTAIGRGLEVLIDGVETREAPCAIELLEQMVASDGERECLREERTCLFRLAA